MRSVGSNPTHSAIYGGENVNEEEQLQDETIEETEETAPDDAVEEEAINEEHRYNEFEDLRDRIERMQGTLERVESMVSAFVENGAVISEVGAQVQEEPIILDVFDDSDVMEAISTDDLDLKI